MVIKIDFLQKPKDWENCIQINMIGNDNVTYYMKKIEFYILSYQGIDIFSSFIIFFADMISPIQNANLHVSCFVFGVNKLVWNLFLVECLAQHCILVKQSKF